MDIVEQGRQSGMWSPLYNIVLQLRLISHLTFSIDSKKDQDCKLLGEQLWNIEGYDEVS